MNKINKWIKITTLLISLTILLFFSIFLDPMAFANNSSLKLIIDGKDVTSTAVPIIQNSRTLVPLRIVAEELGAQVLWDGKDRTVLIEKDNDSIKLKIDSRIIQANKGGKHTFLSDVEPVIINSLTYVPLRLVGNMLGISVDWTESKRLVTVDSSKSSPFEPFYKTRVSGISQGQSITDKTTLKISPSVEELKNAREIKFILLDPDTYKGDVIARGSQLDGRYSWIPNLDHKGEKILIAAIYNSSGKFIAGDAVQVRVNVEPKVSIKGVTQDQTISGNISLEADLNFLASYIKYEIQNLSKGTTTLTSELDPYGPYKWSPQIKDNGNVSFRIIAYDEKGKSYTSDIVSASVQAERQLSLLGVSKGQTINKAVNLLASRNFDVSETEYVLKDRATGKETSIAKIPWGSYEWFPGPELSGDKDVFVRVKDGSGKIY